MCLLVIRMGSSRKYWEVFVFCRGFVEACGTLIRARWLQIVVHDVVFPMEFIAAQLKAGPTKLLWKLCVMVGKKN